MQRATCVLVLINIGLIVGKIVCAQPTETTDTEKQQQPFHPAVAMSCQDILNLDNTSASGKYTLITKSGTIIKKAYCEMGLNGGGYMFLTAQSLADLTNDDIQAMFTDKSSLLMRVRKTDGTQRYAILEQLSQYSQTNVVVHKDGFPANYSTPDNSAAMHIGNQFLYFALLPKTPQRNRLGVKVNEVEVTYEHCDAVMASHFAFFPNFKERTHAVSQFNCRWPFLESIFNNTRLNPSFRGLPDAYYMFTEIHFGGGGVYTDSFVMYSWNKVTGIAMGFR